MEQAAGGSSSQFEMGESSSASRQSAYPLQRIAFPKGDNEGSGGELAGILAFGSTAGMIGLFNLATYKLIYINYGEKPTTRVEFSKDGLLFVANGSTVDKFNCTNLDRIQSYRSGWSTVLDFCLVTLNSNPNQELVCILKFNKIFVFDAAGKRANEYLWSVKKDKDEPGKFTCIAATPTGLIVVGETSGKIRVWSLTRARLRENENYLERSTITAIVTSPSSTWIGAGNRRGAIISHDYDDMGLRHGFRVEGEDEDEDEDDGEVIDIKFPRNFSGCPTVAFESCIAEYNDKQRAVTWKKKMPTYINDSAITSCTVDSQAPTVFTGHQCGKILAYLRNGDCVKILPVDIDGPVLTMDIMSLP